MVTITYANLQTLVKDTTIPAATCEAIIDHAINKINGYAMTDLLPNMSGIAGTKTLSVSSYEAGFIMSVAIAIYMKDYKSAGASSSSYGIGGLSQSQSTSAGGAGEVESLAKSAAEHLRELDVSIG